MHLGQRFRAAVDWSGMPIIEIARRAGVPMSTFRDQFDKEWPNMEITIKGLDVINYPKADFFDPNQPVKTKLEIDIATEVRHLPDEAKVSLLTLLRTVNK